MCKGDNPAPAGKINLPTAQRSWDAVKELSDEVATLRAKLAEANAENAEWVGARDVWQHRCERAEAELAEVRQVRDAEQARLRALVASKRKPAGWALRSSFDKGYNTAVDDLLKELDV